MKLEDFRVMVVNNTTGEQISFEQYLSLYFAQFHQKGRWNKMYIQEMVGMLNALPGAAPKIFGYLLQHRDNSNRVDATNKTIAESLGLSVGSVNTLMARLVKSGFIRRADRGIYMLSPRVITHGALQGRNNTEWRKLA